MSARLWVVRHAPTRAAGRCIGATEVDTEVSHEDAAHRILEALHQAGASPRTVWSSPLSRCAGPAGLVAEILGVPRSIDVRLIEIAHGAFEGRAWVDLERAAPEAMARWMERWEHEGPPGGESARDVQARVEAWLNELRAGAVSADAGSEDVLLVAHAGVARALDVLASGVSWADAMARPVAHLAVHAAITLGNLDAAELGSGTPRRVAGAMTTRHERDDA